MIKYFQKHLFTYLDFDAYSATESSGHWRETLWKTQIYFFSSASLLQRGTNCHGAPCRSKSQSAKTPLICEVELKSWNTGWDRPSWHTELASHHHLHLVKPFSGGKQTYNCIIPSLQYLKIFNDAAFLELKIGSWSLLIDRYFGTL